MGPTSTEPGKLHCCPTKHVYVVIDHKQRALLRSKWLKQSFEGEGTLCCEWRWERQSGHLDVGRIRGERGVEGNLYLSGPVKIAWMLRRELLHDTSFWRGAGEG